MLFMILLVTFVIAIPAALLTIFINLKNVVLDIASRVDEASLSLLY